MEKNDSEEIKMIPIERVASDLVTTKLKIIVHIQDGLLTGEKRDGAWFITLNSINEYRLNHKGKKKNNNCTKECTRPSSCVGCS